MHRALLGGRALDICAGLQAVLLAHVSRVAEVRLRLYRAPSDRLVVGVYYCDRVLDWVVHAVGRVRTDIEKVLGELGKVADAVEGVAVLCRKFVREGEARGEVGALSERLAEKAIVFDELQMRIRSIITRGEGGPLRHMNKPWPDLGLSAEELALDHNDTPVSPAHQQRNASDDVEDMASRKVTDIDAPRSAGSDDFCDRLHVHRSQGTVIPETPELSRRTNTIEPVVTQVSSPRLKRPRSALQEQTAIRRSLNLQLPLPQVSPGKTPPEAPPPTDAIENDQQPRQGSIEKEEAARDDVNEEDVPSPPEKRRKINISRRLIPEGQNQPSQDTTSKRGEPTPAKATPFRTSPGASPSNTT